MFEFLHLKSLLSSKSQARGLRKLFSEEERDIIRKKNIVENLEEAIRERNGDDIKTAALLLEEVYKEIVLELLKSLKKTEKILRRHEVSLQQMADDLRKVEGNLDPVIGLINDERKRIREIAEKVDRALSTAREGGTFADAKTALSEESLIRDLKAFSIKLYRLAGRTQKGEKKLDKKLRDVRDSLDEKAKREIERQANKLEKYLNKEMKYYEEEGIELMRLLDKVMKELNEFYEEIKSLIKDGFKRKYGEQIAEKMKDIREELEKEYSERDKELRFLISQEERIQAGG